MAADLGTSLQALGLLIGFPLLLLGIMWILGWLEAWMLYPYERAAEIERLLAKEGEVEDVETAVARLVADVTPTGEQQRESSLKETAR